MKDSIRYDKTEIDKRRREDFQRAVGARVKELRKQKDWTQEMLSQEAQICDKYVYSIETGKVCMSVWVLCKLARALGVSIDCLLTVDAEQRSASNM